MHHQSMRKAGYYTFVIPKSMSLLISPGKELLSYKLYFAIMHTTTGKEEKRPGRLVRGGGCCCVPGRELRLLSSQCSQGDWYLINYHRRIYPWSAVQCKCEVTRNWKREKFERPAMDEVKRIESAAGWGLEGSWKWSARPRKRKNQRRCAVEGGSSDAFVFAVCSQQGRQDRRDLAWLVAVMVLELPYRIVRI